MRPLALARQIEACTGVQVEAFQKITRGWENTVLEVNGEFIFRFPRFRANWKRFQKEISLLPLLSRELSVSVPRYEFIWEGSRKYPLKFAGYRKIAGASLSKGSFRRAWAHGLGGDLGRFLTQMHSIRPPPILKKLVTEYTVKGWFDANLKFYRDTRRVVYPLLTRDEKKIAQEFWKDFFWRFGNHHYRPTLVHRDLTGGNLIVDSSKGRLNGVIDWADVSIADPAFDFAGLFEVNARLGERALEVYGLPKEGFRERIDLYYRGIPFGEIAWGVKQKSDHWKELGLRHFRQRLS